MGSRHAAARSGRHPRPRPWPMAAASALIVLAGCQGNPTPPPPGQDAARETLVRALSSWQKGETIAAVEQASPPIKVSEPRWEGGNKLARFELQGSGRPRGDQQSFQVTLWLTGARGKPAKEMAEYRVSTSPVESVTRSVFD